MSKDSKGNKKNFCSFFTRRKLWIHRVCDTDSDRCQSMAIQTSRQFATDSCCFFLRANTHSHTNTQRSSSVSVTKDCHGCKGSNKSKDKNGPPSSFVSLNSWMLILWAAVCSLPSSGSLLLYRHPPVELPHRRMGSH